jgi:hypothetical protein
MKSDAILYPEVGMIIKENDYRYFTSPRKIVAIYNDYVATRGGSDGRGRSTTISRKSLEQGRYKLIRK